MRSDGEDFESPHPHARGRTSRESARHEMLVAMQSRLFAVFCALAGCGDNYFSDPDAGIDAAPDSQAVDALTGQCTDSVTAVMTGNPGSTAASYPATGWWLDDTRANGAVTVDPSLGVPTGFGCRSVKLITGASTASPSADKAQLMTFARSGTAMSTITTINYWAYRSSSSTGNAAIDLALNVSITGTTVPTNFAYLVYEPYQQSTGNAGIMNDTWQHWDATATTPGDGVWWTSKIPNGTPGSQANPISWAAFQTLYPDAKIHGYGFNLGSVNPNMIVGGDGLVFGTTTTDF